MASDEVVSKGPESRAELKARFNELREKIKRMEATEVSGAPSRMQPGDILDVGALQDAQPDSHFRFVNPLDPKKVDNRRRAGYVPVTDAEATEAGVKARVGNDLILMKQPAAAHERAVAELKQLNKERLDAHKAEVTRAAEAVARELHDRHGIDVPVERLMVNE